MAKRCISIAPGPNFRADYAIYQALCQEAASPTIVLGDQVGIVDGMASPAALPLIGTPGYYGLRSLLAPEAGQASNSVYLPTQSRVDAPWPFVTVRSLMKRQDRRFNNLVSHSVAVIAWDRPAGGTDVVSRIMEIVYGLLHEAWFDGPGVLEILHQDERGPEQQLDYGIWQASIFHVDVRTTNP